MSTTAEYRQAIEEWLAQKPSLAASGFGRRMSPAFEPVLKAGRAVVPVSLLEQALLQGSRSSRRLALRERMLTQAGVTSVAALAARDLDACDRQWRRQRGWAMGLAGGTGAVSGVAGMPGLVLDIPTLILQSLIGIHRTGLCYGYDCMDDSASGFALAIFALASANTLPEKQAAWAALVAMHSLEAEALRDGLEAAVARQLGKGSVAAGMQNLARQLGVNLGRRKAAAVVPVLGALVGGSINAWVMHDLMRVARYAFIARRIGMLDVAQPCDV
ncbi:MAG: EcsC family protein [Nevskiales bacterium]